MATKNQCFFGLQKTLDKKRTELNNMKWILLRNSYHYGDQLMTIMFFIQLKDELKEKNIRIQYRCYEKYHKELRKWMEVYGLDKIIELVGMEKEEREEDELDVWLGNRRIIKLKYICVEEWKRFYEKVKKLYDFKTELKFGFPLIKRDLSKSQFDILICNSFTYSGQATPQMIVDFDRWILDFYVKEQEKDEKDRKRIIITRPLVTDKGELIDIPYTSQYGCETLYEIGEMSRECEWVIGFITGPVMATFWEDRLKTKRWILYDANGYQMKHEKIEYIKEWHQFRERIEKLGKR